MKKRQQYLSLYYGYMDLEDSDPNLKIRFCRIWYDFNRKDRWVLEIGVTLLKGKDLTRSPIRRDTPMSKNSDDLKHKKGSKIFVND